MYKLREEEKENLKIQIQNIFKPADWVIVNDEKYHFNYINGKGNGDIVNLISEQGKYLNIDLKTFAEKVLSENRKEVMIKNEKVISITVEDKNIIQMIFTIITAFVTKVFC